MRNWQRRSLKAFLNFQLCFNWRHLGIPLFRWLGWKSRVPTVLIGAKDHLFPILTFSRFLFQESMDFAKQHNHLWQPSSLPWTRFIQLGNWGVEVRGWFQKIDWDKGFGMRDNCRWGVSMWSAGICTAISLEGRRLWFDCTGDFLFSMSSIPLFPNRRIDGDINEAHSHRHFSKFEVCLDKFLVDGVLCDFWNWPI